MTSPALEAAQHGNKEAIAAIINRSLQKKGITASVDFDHGDLHVMLDARQVPPETAADFIFKGVQRLNIEPAYDVHVYGRKVGEPFATWCHDYELKTRPFALVNSSVQQHAQINSEPGFTIRLSGVNSEEISLDVIQIMGFVGIVITILGIFSPVLTAPIVGTVNYLRNGAEEAIILIVLTALSTLLLARKHYSWLYGSSVWSFLLVGGTFWYYHSLISELKASTDRELAGNPFRGLADMAMAATGLSWGWFFLFLGTGLVVVVAYLRKRKLDRQAFLALAAPPLAAVVIAIISIPYYSVTSSGQANKAREATARTYIGTINRGQQAFQLENNGFAGTLDELGSSLSSESDYYKYQITISDDDMTAVAATAKTGGLRSFIGAVFVIGNDKVQMHTKSIWCQSNRPSKSAPSLPSISEGSEPKCASGSSND
ncbi:MAG: type IV pilin-like G/H family protein [Kaiparowitsia implicata GSE-PSE-MK54-09C]|jgi:type II secretory pathway pseudopilin PulG|nr:type IV pilin-like G/H family protein [Kaiparowitsia implicata GSE-PSE-MK54-09C]